MTKKENDLLLKLIEKGIKEFPKVLKRKKLAHEERKKRLKAFAPVSKALQIELSKQASGPAHPWRLCPQGQFFRKKHKQSPYVRSNGKAVRGSIHPNECVINKTGKDQLYAEEAREIAARHFGALTNLPSAGILSMYPNEKNFDAMIAGWTKYWNDILQPTQALDENLVKALIATESGFVETASNKKRGIRRARGLMQVTDETVKLLSSRSKELKDHYINLTADDMLDPNLSICAGIRWLFRKREILLARNKNVSWPEVVLEYKSYSSLDSPQMKKFLGYYEALKTKDKNKIR